MTRPSSGPRRIGLCKMAALSLAAAFAISGTCVADENAPPTMQELLNVLQIRTYRLRAPSEGLWDIEVLKPAQLRPQSAAPRGLTTATFLFAMREDEGGAYEFTLPESNGGFSQGKFELCKQVDCSGAYAVNWLKQPRYSEDGSQCVVAEYYFFDEKQPSAYVVLVKANPPTFPVGDSVTPLVGAPAEKAAPVSKHR